MSRGYHGTVADNDFAAFEAHLASEPSDQVRLGSDEPAHGLDVPPSRLRHAWHAPLAGFFQDFGQQLP